jgi:hypothetical protein
MPEHIITFPHPGTFYNNEEVAVAVHEWLRIHRPVSNCDGKASDYVNSDNCINVPGNWIRKVKILVCNKWKALDAVVSFLLISMT